MLARGDDVKFHDRASCVDGICRPLISKLISHAAPTARKHEPRKTDLRHPALAACRWKNSCRICSRSGTTRHREVLDLPMGPTMMREQRVRREAAPLQASRFHHRYRTT
jgi:hypothetical protein